LNWLHGALVAKLQAACTSECDRWHGLRRLAADKTTLTLPESKSLWNAFGGHKGQQGLGPIAVELCCLFDLVSRAPLRFVNGKSATSEHKLIKKLIECLRKNDVLLLDAGFYYCATFVRILARRAHFIIPTKTTTRPQVLSTLGPGDYLCRILDSHSREPLTVRALFVYRNGFRRRRLITSLLDPNRFPAAELAQLYHMRWDIETFYRDFKHSLRASRWHCLSPMSFQKELLMHMIAICLIRIATLDASRAVHLPAAQLSFSRALTETRVFLRLLLIKAAVLSYEVLWQEFVHRCSRHRTQIKPNRQFSRNRQEYRKKSRGLQKLKKGRKCVTKCLKPQTPAPEIISYREGLFLLS
jgi:hypothetical protein